MKALVSLTGLSFKQLLLTSMNFGSRGKKGRARSGAAALFFLIVLMLVLSGSFAMQYGVMLAPVGGLPIMLAIMLIMSIAWPFIFLVYSAQSAVFGTKDTDLIFSLPVSSFSILVSRAMALYLEALVMCEVMLIPAGAVWLWQGGGGGAMFMLGLLVCGMFLALLPTLLSLVFGALVSIFVARLPNKNLFNIVFSLLFTLGILAVSMWMSFSMVDMETAIQASAAMDIAGIQNMVVNALPPIGWAVNALTGSPLQLVPLAAVCVLPSLLVCWLLSLVYKPLITSLASRRLKTNFKLGTMRASGAFATLYKKEWRRFFGTPTLVLNAGFSPLSIILASAAALIFKGNITDFIAEFAVMVPGGTELVATYLPPLVLIAVVFFTALTFTACTSISLEGKNLWILKSSPVSTGQIFTAKAGLNFMLAAVPCIICIPVFAYVLEIGLPVAALMLLFCLLYALFTSVFGLFCNLLLPRLDAENESMLIKNSASANVTVLVSMLLMAALVGGYVLFVRWGLNFTLYTLAASGLVALLCVLFILLLGTKGRKLFAEL